MENDNLEHLGSVELVSSETTGYLDKDGKFVYGEPPAPVKVENTEVYVQTDEDIV